MNRPSMINPILSSIFNLRRYRAARRRVFVLIDTDTGVSTAEYLRCLRPWFSWIHLTGIVAAKPETLLALLTADTLHDTDIVLIVSVDAATNDAAAAACARLRTTCVNASVAFDGSRELALMQEVEHHDYELGGRNEWTGGDSQFGPPVLRSLSVAHCRAMFPHYVERHLERIREATGGAPIEAADVGCGPVSKLRWAALNGQMTITGVDPLLDMYAIVRERHGLDVLPAIACAHELCVGAETLPTRVGPDRFDFVYSVNALDHTEDPLAVVQGIAHILRPGGIFALQVYTREGSRENWWQLHQFDLYVDEHDRPVCETRDGVVRPLFPDGCGLVVRDIVARDVTTALVAERAAS